MNAAQRGKQSLQKVVGAVQETQTKPTMEQTVKSIISLQRRFSAEGRWVAMRPTQFAGGLSVYLTKKAFCARPGQVVYESSSLQTLE